jgi:hypothetical protein
MGNLVNPISDRFLCVNALTTKLFSFSRLAMTEDGIAASPTKFEQNPRQRFIESASIFFDEIISMGTVDDVLTEC